jgi:hypothetical protein
MTKASTKLKEKAGCLWLSRRILGSSKQFVGRSDGQGPTHNRNRHCGPYMKKRAVSAPRSHVFRVPTSWPPILCSPRLSEPLISHDGLRKKPDGSAHQFNHLLVTLRFVDSHLAIPIQRSLLQWQSPRWQPLCALRALGEAPMTPLPQRPQTRILSSRTHFRLCHHGSLGRAVDHHPVHSR